ncbi:MAG: LCP family protein [Chloroflexota bacterium]
MTLVSLRKFELVVDGQMPVRFELGQTPLSLGRDGTCFIVLPDAQVSRKHAELYLRGDVPVIRDAGSSNGTRVNGEQLHDHAERVLSHADTLAIGPYRLIFRHAAHGNEVWEQPDPPTIPIAVAAQRSDGSPTRAPRSEKPRLVRNLLMGALSAVLLVVGVVLGAVWFFSPPNLSLLVLGSDARPSELAAGDRGRTDTLVAYVADRVSGRNLLISVPRDLWVQTSPTSSGKINTVYRQGGGEAAKGAVTQALGLPVDRYLVIGLQGVRDIVDALGGIDILVDTAIRDTSYPTDDYGTTVFEITPGPHHLDGETALRYARTRHGDDDLARIARQQRVMLGIRDAISSPANVWRLPNTALAISRATMSDLNPLDVASLMVAYARAPGPPERMTPTWNMVLPFTAPSGEAALRVQPALREALAILIIGPGTAIEVLNAAGRNGVAAKASSMLNSRGLKIDRVSTAERTQADSLIQIRARNRLAARSLASLVGIASSAVRETQDLPDDVDIRVILGSNYAAP